MYMVKVSMLHLAFFNRLFAVCSHTVYLNAQHNAGALKTFDLGRTFSDLGRAGTRVCITFKVVTRITRFGLASGLKRRFC